MTKAKHSILYEYRFVGKGSLVAIVPISNLLMNSVVLCTDS